MAPTPPLTPAEIILRQAQQLVEHERRLAEQNERIRRIEAKQQAIEEGFKFFTVLAWAKLNDLTIDLGTAQRLGKQATTLSHERGTPIDRVRDPRFGQVNAYHDGVLQAVFAAEFRL